ncbi:unnamed protein product [Mycena citricolor]|uniref:Uncharacterized protein n=1 Tax=Mycena citricolor TaxID=2018698 RepID=A0AAD2H7X8_9AGAR|nr:unnamed protein product [Mycena citricolor]
MCHKSALYLIVFQLQEAPSNTDHATPPIVHIQRINYHSITHQTINHHAAVSIVNCHLQGPLTRPSSSRASLSSFQKPPALSSPQEASEHGCVPRAPARGDGRLAGRSLCLRRGRPAAVHPALRGESRTYGARPIAETSKIIVNVALIYDRLGERAEAIEQYTKAIELDKYLAVGYFQRGVSRFHAGDFEGAAQDFGEAERMMRTNVEIDYDVLGLNYKLKLPEIRYNKWLALSRLDRTADARDALKAFNKSSPSPDLSARMKASVKDVINAEPCSLPSGTLYRPSPIKLQMLMGAAPPSPSFPAPPATIPPTTTVAEQSTRMESSSKPSKKRHKKNQQSISSGEAPDAPADVTSSESSRVQRSWFFRLFSIFTRKA